MARTLSAVVLAVAMSLALATGNAQAAIIFADNFDAEPAGSQLNYAAFANWDVVAGSGTVDLIATGGFGITCVGGVGKCVDMDGSTSNAGRLESKTTFNLVPGDYVLTFSASGNQRGGAADSMSFGFDGFSDSIVNLASNAPFATFTLPFTLLAPTAGTIFFDHAGGDNVGIILDNVLLESRDTQTPVPEPSTVLLLGAGAVGLCAWLRRR